MLSSTSSGAPASTSAPTASGVATTSAGAGERSLIGIGSALRITCTGRLVSIEALSANGRSLLPWIAEMLSDPGRFASVGVTTSGDVVTAVFPPPPDGPRDAEA